MHPWLDKDEEPRRLRRRASPRLLVAVLVASFAIHALSLAIVHNTGDVAVLLPGNGVLLGLVLTRAGGRRVLAGMLAAGGLGDMLACLATGVPLIEAVPFAAINVLEVLLSFVLLRWWGTARAGFDNFRSVGALLATCAVAPLGSCALGASIVAGVEHTAFMPVWLDWLVAEALGLALATPASVIAVNLRDEGRPVGLIAMRRLSDIIVTLGLVALVAATVFLFGDRLLLFTVLPFVLIATFRLRQVGAIAAVAIVAVIALHATTSGFGPIALATPNRIEQFLFLQFFLAVTFLSALPIAAALTERDARANEAHLIADHFKTVVENASEVIFRTDTAGRWTYLNPAWETISGYSQAESIGRTFSTWVDPDEQDKIAEWVAPVLAGEVRATRRMLRFCTASGAVRWMELAIQSLCDQDGRPIGATGTLRDIDDRKRLEEHVLIAKRRAEERARAATLLASTDELTGLANRRAFLRHLDRQTEAATEFGWRLTVAMFDVDHFKRVNDRYGHAVGDKVLQRVARRASAVCRAGDLIGRLGGEEFAVLMPSAGPDDAHQVAERLRQAIETPLPGEDEIDLPTVTVSIGIATRLRDQTGAEVLAQADSALYAAKDAGRNRIKIAA